MFEMTSYKHLISLIGLKWHHTNILSKKSDVCMMSFQTIKEVRCLYDVISNYQRSQMFVWCHFKSYQRSQMFVWCHFKSYQRSQMFVWCHFKPIKEVRCLYDVISNLSKKSDVCMMSFQTYQRSQMFVWCHFKPIKEVRCLYDVISNWLLW